EWLEAGDEELTLVADAESADLFIQKLGLLFLANNAAEITNFPEGKPKLRNSEQEELIRKKELKEYIDFLLDVYNDYYFLYQMFKDPEYEQVMKMILEKLSSIVNGDETNPS